MDFENRNVTPDGQEPAPQTNSEFRPPEPQPYAQPVQNPQDTAPMQTPYQAQVRGSDEAPQTAPSAQTPYQTPVRASDDAPVYHDEAHQPDAVQPPFEPGTQSYATFQQWQEQESKKHGRHEKKPRSKKPLLVLGGVAVAVALFFGGMAIGGWRSSGAADISLCPVFAPSKRSLRSAALRRCGCPPRPKRWSGAANFQRSSAATTIWPPHSAAMPPPPESASRNVSP